MRSAIATVRAMPRTFQVVLVGILINRVGTFIGPFLTLMAREHYGFTPTEAGALFFAFGTGSVVSLTVGGYLTDRLGRRATLILGLIGGGLSAMALALAETRTEFALLLVLLGFLGDLPRPAAQAMIGDLLSPAMRATGFACLRTAVNVGWAIALALGGLLADRFSPAVLFVGDGMTTLLYGLIVLAAVPETRPKDRPSSEQDAADGVSWWTDTVLFRVLVANVLSATVMTTLMTVFPLTVTEGAGYPKRVYGFVMATNGAMVALLEISLVRRLAPFRRLRVAAVGMALSGLAVGSVGLVFHWAWWVLVMLVFTLAEIMLVPQVMSFITDWAPVRWRGRYMGIQSAGWSIAFAVGPLVLIPLRQRLGDARFWPLLLLPLAAAAWMLHRLDR
ncbi:MAG: MFS transporter, partial [Planctomycetota bacterium]